MTTSTALATRQPAQVQDWSPHDSEVLQAYPDDKFNVLVPTQVVRQVNPYLAPVVEVVQLSPDERRGDIYHDTQMKDGYFAPTAKGLAKIRQVAGIDELESRRTDDGSDPDVVEWTVRLEMLLPSGQRVRGFGTKRVDLKAMSFASEAHKRRTRQFMLENAQTKALNRALRSLLSLHGSMPRDQLTKPFAVLHWVPNMAHPDVRQAFLAQLAPSSARLFGSSEPSAPQLTSAEVVEAPEASEEDDAPPVDPETGEVAGDEPDWAIDSGEPTPGEQLVVVLRDRAEASSAKGGATKPQRERLQAVLRGLGTANVMAVLGPTFGLTSPSQITAAQADAVLDHAEGRTDFQEIWRAAAAELAAPGSQS